MLSVFIREPEFQGQTKDKLATVEAGRIVEAGTHEELVDGGGLYAALWRVQTGEAVAAAAD
jgi:ABC-type transport system involved in cytochrome bd biosynthesis fused ATPase/permease subunit